MSEPIFTAGGGAAAPAATEPQPETPSNRKALLAVGGVVGALVVGAGAFFVLTQGAPQDELAQGAKQPGVTAPGPQASAPAKPAGTKVVKVATVTSRDPFVALFPDPKPTGDSTSGGGTVTTPTDGTAPSGGTPTTPPDQSTSTTYKVAVTIIKESEGVAQITVDGKPYSAGVGRPFAPYFTLYAIFNSECVGVLFGDQSVPVCKGAVATVVS